MPEVAEDWLWSVLELLDDEEFEELCAAAASVKTRNANSTRRVILFMSLPRGARLSRFNLDEGALVDRCPVESPR